MKIRVCTENDFGGALEWIPYSIALSGGAAFQPLFTHELGHALGFNHVDDCNSAPMPASVMRMNSFSQANGLTHWGALDRAGLRAFFWYRNKDLVYRYTSNGTSWSGTPGVSTPAGSPYTLVRDRPAANSSDSSLNDVYFAYMRSDSQLRTYKWDGANWTLLLTDAPTVHRPAHASIAVDSGGQTIRVGYQDVYSETDGTLEVLFKRSLNAGASFHTTGWYVPVTTQVPGTAQAFDPASGTFVTFWRSSLGLVNYGISNSEIVYYAQYSGGDPVYSLDTPSVSCGSVALAGTYNCLVVWNHVESWTGAPRYAHFRVVGDQLEFYTYSGAIGYVTVGTPVVSFGYRDPARPWSLAFSQAGPVIYTLRKAASAYTGPWTDQSSINVAPGTDTDVGLPAMGVRKGYRYVFANRSY